MPLEPPLLDAEGRSDLRSLPIAGIRERVEGLGKERFRALQVYKWAWQRRARTFAEMTNISKDFREEMDHRFYLHFLELVGDLRSVDGTRKLAWRLEDGARVESVLIPEVDRLTLCISTQVGCAMGCRFCVTGDLGFGRNMKPSEIILQAAQAQDLLSDGERISNIVLMGMGEPLRNLENVLVALEILLDQEALNFSHRKITVSTSGLVPELEELARRSPVNLAVSLNATTDEQRDLIMPINRKYPLADLIKACRALPLPAGKRITFEYVMFAGFNDSLADAARLVRLLHGVKAKINLIPYNESPRQGFRRPDDAMVKAFQDFTVNHGIQCSIRSSRGRDILAACGQLGGLPGVVGSADEAISD